MKKLTNVKTPQIVNGWLNSALLVPSPNFDERPQNTKISLIVIHSISLPPTVFRGNAVCDFFQNKLDFSANPYFAQIVNLKVSAHFFIRRRGMVIQLVSCNQRAWHAGESNFHGMSACNNFSIGIELEGADDLPFTITQYKKLNWLLAILKKYYQITDIAGHNQIAPSRKTDPGKYFEWSKVEF